MLLIELLLVFVIGFVGLRTTKNGYYEDYLSKDKTSSVKGIFILLIVFTHSLPYIERSGYQFLSIDDKVFMSSLYHLGQLVVVMFLFYSGYGVSESLKGGGSYVKSMPYRRILTTLINFDIAVVVFIIISLLLGISITFKHALLALTGWENVGIVIGISSLYYYVIWLVIFHSFYLLRIKNEG